MTPSHPYATLPVVEPNDHLHYWLSGVQSHLDANSMKRLLPDSEYAGSMKRARYNTQTDSQLKDTAQSSSLDTTSSQDINIQSQFDFNFPPVACLSYSLPECDSVQLKSFRYSIGDTGDEHLSLLYAG